MSVVLDQCVAILIRPYPEGFNDLPAPQQVQIVFDRYIEVVNKIREKLSFISQGPNIAPCMNTIYFQQAIPSNSPDVSLSKVFITQSPALKVELFKQYMTTLQMETIQDQVDGLVNFYKLFGSIWYDATCASTMTASFNMPNTGAQEICTVTSANIPVPSVPADPRLSNTNIGLTDYVGIIVYNAIMTVAEFQPATKDVKIQELSNAGTPTGNFIMLSEVVNELEKRNKMYEYMIKSVGNYLFGASKKIMTTNTYTPGATETSPTPPCPPLVNVPSYLTLLP